MLRIPRAVSALLSALRFTAPHPELLRDLTDEEWKDLLSFCDSTQLTLLMAHIAIDEAPEWVRARLSNNLVNNALRFEMTKRTYREVAGALRKAGVDHLVLKGFCQW